MPSEDQQFVEEAVVAQLQQGLISMSWLTLRLSIARQHATPLQAHVIIPLEERAAQLARDIAALIDVVVDDGVTSPVMPNE